jgi:parvulin-like peptidyl-prolyl isomerase
MPKIKSLIALIFILLFAAPCFGDNDVAITVNGNNIYKDEFDYILKNTLGAAKDDYALEQKKKILIDKLIDSQLYIQEAKRRGVTAKMFAGEEEIDDYLLSDPPASGEEKAARDRAERVILKYKESQILPIKAISAIKEDIPEDDVKVIEEYYKRAEKIEIKYILVDPFVMADNMEISGDDVRSYYRDHQDQFVDPAVKRYQILFFDPKDFTADVNFTPQRISRYYHEHTDDLRAAKSVNIKYVLFRTKDYLDQLINLGVNSRQYYQENLEKFAEPAEAKVRAISLKKPLDKKKLQDLQGELKQWVSFSDLAKKYSDDPALAQSGGDMGIIKKGLLKEPFNSIVFSLDAGEVSGPVEAGDSYKIFYVERKKDGRIPSFDEVKGAIEEQLLADAADPFALADAKRFKVEAKKDGFEKAAANKRLTVFETGMFGPSDRIPAFKDDAPFKSAALGLDLNEISDEMQYEKGYAVLKAAEIKGFELRSLDQVSGEVEKKILDEDSSAYAASDADFALKLLKDNVPLDEIRKRVKAQAFITDSASFESNAGNLSVKKTGNGYYIALPYDEAPSTVIPYEKIAGKAASLAALDRADKVAGIKAAELLASGAVTAEAAVEAIFAREDYVINKDYVRPLIEQCSEMADGQTGIIKSSGKYYVVMVVQRAIQIPGYKDDSAVIKSEVLKEKRAEYAKDWLIKEREKAQVQINI